MIVTVSEPLRTAGRARPSARPLPPARPPNPPWGTRPREPALGNAPGGTRPREPARESATGTRPAGASPTVRGRPVTGFSEPPLPVPVTVFWVGPAGPAGRADDAPAGP